MANVHSTKRDPDRPAVYQIRIEGRLDPRWATWFGDVAVTAEDGGVTLLTCKVGDQTALYGLLRKVRDLGLPLLAINRVETGEGAGSEAGLSAEQ